MQLGLVVVVALAERLPEVGRIEGAGDLLVELAVREADVGPAPRVGAVLDHQAPVAAALLRLVDRGRHGGPVGPEERAEKIFVVGRAFGEARRAPLERVLAVDGERGVERERAGQLRLRQEQLLGLHARAHGGLLVVERALAEGDRRLCRLREQRVAPVHVVAAELQRRGRAADVEAREGERIQDLSRRAVNVAIGVVRIVAVLVERGDHRLEGVGCLDVPAIRGIGPGRGAHAQARALLVDEVQLGQQVEPVQDHVALVELVVADGTEHRHAGVRELHPVVDALHPPAGVVADFIVEAQLRVRIAGVDLEGLRLHRGCPAERRDQRGDASLGVGTQSARRTGTIHFVSFVWRGIPRCRCGRNGSRARGLYR